MTTTEQQSDPRPAYRAALTWVRDLINTVPRERLGDPTPCAEFDVRTLISHAIGVVNRTHALIAEEPLTSRPAVATGIADADLASTFGQAVDALNPLYDNDSILDALVEAPWGRAPGRAVVWVYINEMLVHGWDLAVATEQQAEADPQIAATVLAAITTFVPAEPRGGQVPFAPPVDPAPDAGPTERLANWCGHRR